MKNGRLDLDISKIADLEITIHYRLPLSGELASWTTKDFVAFVRKYITLHMAKIYIIKIIFKGDYNGEDK